MTFKSYSLNYLELFHRLATQNGPEGKKAAALMLATLFLLAGAGGMPFADDLDDLIDALMQRLGYNFSSKRAKQEFLESVFGKAGARFVERGITGLPGVPLDASSRFGMGSLVPGTGLFLDKKDHGRDVMEFLGPAGDMITRAGKAVDALASGNVKAAILAGAPKAVYNAAKGADMADTGMYRDDRGYKVIDSNLIEAAFKSIGFQPANVSQVQESNYLQQKTKDFYNLHAQDISAKWAKAIFEKDRDGQEEARNMVVEWNKKNPGQRITPNMPSIIKKARQMAMDKDQRIAATAPKAMRQQFRAEIAANRAERQ